MRNGADIFIKLHLNLFTLLITIKISKIFIFDPGKSWKTIHEIVNVHTKIAIRLSKILSPIVYCYAGVFQRFCSVTSTHLWICLILISRTNSQMNWYIIININLFLTKLKTNWILNCMKTKEYCDSQRIWNLLVHTANLYYITLNIKWSM